MYLLDRNAKRTYAELRTAELDMVAARRAARCVGKGGVHGWTPPNRFWLTVTNIYAYTCVCMDRAAAPNPKAVAPRDLLDVYIDAADAEGGGAPLIEESLLRTIFDIFIAGGDTTATAICGTIYEVRWWAFVGWMGRFYFGSGSHVYLHLHIRTNIGGRPPPRLGAGAGGAGGRGPG